MKKLLLSLLVLTACQNDRIANDGISEFFGEGSNVINLTNHPNGYDISILKTKDLCLWHFERGDSINRYLALHGLPSDIEFTADTCSMEIDLPTKTELTGRFGECFFMDVNFDGEPDFIVPYIGYNTTLFACFDLVNGNWNEPCIGFLAPMDKEPFINFVAGEYGETKFDYENKSIYISRQTGAGSIVQIWVSMVESPYEHPSLKVTKRVETDYYPNMQETHIATYELQGDSLKQVSFEIEKWD